MSLELRRHAELAPAQITALEDAMAAFYRNAPSSYYKIADLSAQNYTPTERPFHCDLVNQVKLGDKVIELGCGTAHLCPYVEQRGGTYTGVDHGATLLEGNAKCFPRARFFPVGTAITETFDLVASLYTIEHIVNPPAYLENLWTRCRPGGLIGIICPEFVDSPSPAPSVFCGKTPRRLREKIQRFAFGDALGHVLDVKFRTPRWQAEARQSAPGAFWINLRPRVLHGAEYSIDADAVHLTRLKDLVEFFRQRGAEIVRTSAEMPGVSADVLRFNCYVLARKPGASATAK